MGAERLLTDRKCRNASAAPKPYRISDGGGLFLLVRPEGHKYWQYRYRYAAREKLYQIGPYPEVSLEQARGELVAMRTLVRDGKDPVIERRLRRVTSATLAETTFEALSKDWLEYNRPSWSATHYERNAGLLRRVLFPFIGKLPVDQVQPATLLHALREAERRHILESARRARAVASQVFSWAIATQRATSNPALSLVRALRVPEVKHFAALPIDQLGEFLQRLRADGSLDAVVRAALKLMLFTGLRDRELRAAKWSELDLSEGVWTIPAERMKRRIQHKVPLPTQAFEALTELHPLTYRSPDSFVFASPRAKLGHLAENTLRLAIHRLGFNVTAHGFRSLLTDALNELGYRPDWIERQLHHAETNKTVQAYKRTDFLEQRKKMMQSWADYCDRREEGLSHERAALSLPLDNVLQLVPKADAA